MNTPRYYRYFIRSGFILTLLLSSPAAAVAQLRIGDICHVKGQEENTLQGVGLVVGLQGTGDASPATMRGLARAMELMGSPVGKTAQGQMVIDELKDTKNVAMVFVSVTVPPQGAREGDTLNCTVSAISAKSLKGGVLLTTPLLGPRPGSTRIYGFARGELTMNGTDSLTTASVAHGCRLEEDLPTEYLEDGTFTLVLKNGLASFNAAYEIAFGINTLLRAGESYGDPRRGMRVTASPEDDIAKAQDAKNIVVQIPEHYAGTEIQFITEVLGLRLSRFPQQATVFINEREGVIIVGEDVEIRPTGINHKNLTVEPAAAAAPGQFVAVDPSADTSTTKLQALINALNALKVPTTDQIAIIKGLDDSGHLYGTLLIE